jgi:hypothetical protein
MPRHFPEQFCFRRMFMTTQFPKSHGRYDDLTVIKGIGQSRQQWLRERLGIKTYGDMAALLAEDVYASLKEDGQIIALTDIESWIEQAGRLVSDTPTSPHQKVRTKGWQPFGSFVIEFQENKRTGEKRTSAHHVEADRTEIWAGVEQRQLCQWMTQQLGEQWSEEADGFTLREDQTMPEATAEQPMTTEGQPMAANIPQPVITADERLQQILAKVARFKTPVAAPLPAASSTKMPQPAAVTTTQPSEPETKTPTGFSPELQAVLKKAQALRARKM